LGKFNRARNMTQLNRIKVVLSFTFSSRPM
jgi:hypothetical protein